MMILLFVFLCFLPLCLWLVYCLYSNVCTFFSAIRGVLFGLLSVFLALFLVTLTGSVSRGMSGLSLLLFTCFISSALFEESSKLLLVCVLPEIRTPQRSSRVIASYAILIGLSFASFETLLYGLRNPSIVYLRFLTSLPVHACATLLCSAWIGTRSARMKGFAFLFAGIGLHGAYNLSMNSGGFYLWTGLLCVLVLAGLSLYLWRQTTAETLPL